MMLGRALTLGRLGATKAAPKGALFKPTGGAVRGLGLTTKGPPINDIAANYAVAKTFFTKPAISYFQYKAQCEALRLFTVTGVTLGCCVLLFLDPPKSSYWLRWSPISWPWQLKSAFSAKEPLDKKYQTETDVATIYSDLTLKRRLNKPVED